MKNLYSALAWLVLAAALSACGAIPKQRDNLLEETLRNYEQYIRWSEWEAAANLLHPNYLLEHPISRLDMDRLKLFRVTNYTVRSAAPYDEGNGFRQSVEIRLFNRTRAVEKEILDNQDWKYDENAKVWMLHTGLPDVTQRY